jgi:hypothetical protein
VIQEETTVKLDKEFRQDGIMTFVGWQRLLPYLEKAIDKREVEKITGLTIRNDGIKVHIVHRK